MVAKQHHHWHENGGKDGPFGRSAANKHVDARREGNDTKDKGDAVLPFQQRRALDGDDDAEVAPVEEGEHLRGKEDDNDVGAHVCHGVAHHARYVSPAFGSAGDEGIDQAGEEEEQGNDEDNAVHQGGFFDEAAGRGITQQCAFRHGEDEQQDEQGEQGVVRGAHGLAFAGADAAIIVCYHAGFRGVLPHARQEDFARYPPGDHEQQESGGSDEVVVHRGIKRHFVVNQGGGGLGEGQREYIGEADGEVGGKSAEAGGVGADHAGDGVIAHAQKEQRGYRRQDNDGGIGGHVAHDADEDDDGDEQVGGGAGDSDFHQRFEPAGFFRDADADHGSEDDAERREAGKVFHCVFDDAHDVFTVQQVDSGDGFAVGRVGGGYAR